MRVLTPSRALDLLYADRSIGCVVVAAILVSVLCCIAHVHARSSNRGSAAGIAVQGLPASSSQGDRRGTFTDPRDGQVYRWVRIGTQVWMAENLRFKPATGWKCWNDVSGECARRGVFYDWQTAVNVPPRGWHLPSDAEWKALERELGVPAAVIDVAGLDRVNDAARSLKKPGSWPTAYAGKPIEVTGESGFDAVPTGFFALGEFTHEGYAGWWTATSDGEKAWVRAVAFHADMITRALNDKQFFFPIRCVRDGK
jgi:uncharacterized protein (TIGR02145 family)